MILFRPDMKRAILDRRKYVTRRQGEKRWKVGSWHLLYTRPPYTKGGAKPFARVQIVSVIDEDEPGMRCGIRADLAGEARCEGFQCWAAFCTKYLEINGSDALDKPCWRVEWDPDTMEVLECIECGKECDGDGSICTACSDHLADVRDYEQERWVDNRPQGEGVA